jgi:hypothetical protein
MNDISDPEEDAGYRTLTYPFHGNEGFGKAIRDVEKLYGNISVLRVFQGWAGTTVVYKKVEKNE